MFPLSAMDVFDGTSTIDNVPIKITLEYTGFDINYFEYQSSSGNWHPCHVHSPEKSEDGLEFFFTLYRPVSFRVKAEAFAEVYLNTIPKRKAPVSAADIIKLYSVRISSFSSPSYSVNATLAPKANELVFENNTYIRDSMRVIRSEFKDLFTRGLNLPTATVTYTVRLGTVTSQNQIYKLMKETFNGNLDALNVYLANPLVSDLTPQDTENEKYLKIEITSSSRGVVLLSATFFYEFDRTNLPVDDVSVVTTGS
jgi:hypothetical protein